PAFFTAVTRVESTGLALAADATGAVAMPVNEPGPSLGTAEHAAPKVWAAALALESLPAAAPPSEAVELLSLLPHAARPSVAPSAIAAIPVRRISVFMVFVLSHLWSVVV